MSDFFESGKESSSVNSPQNLPQTDSEDMGLEGYEAKVKPSANDEDLAGPLMMVETAFLASTASLIWLVNYYFPMARYCEFFSRCRSHWYICDGVGDRLGWGL